MPSTTCPAATATAHDAGAWVHVDGAFGQGEGGVRAPADYVLESSRRARGFSPGPPCASSDERAPPTSSSGAAPTPAASPPCWAPPKGVTVVNDVMLNQLLRFGGDDETNRVVDAVQDSGVCWMGTTTWHGMRLMRISVSSWRTTEADVDRSVNAIRARGSRTWSGPSERCVGDRNRAEAKVPGVPVGVVIGLCSAVLAALVTEVYCHRCLAHRAFGVRPGVASLLDTYFQVVVGTHPETWAAVHRLHHRYADTPLDPHSPRQRRPLAVLVGNAYLFAVARKQLPADAPTGRGILHLTLRSAVIGFFFVLFGLAQVLTMLAVHLVCYLGVMGLVNSVGHLYGSKPHPDSPGYDLAWLAIPLLGHGYHNSHHAHPAAARTGRLDPVWPLLRLLAALRLVELDGRRAHLAPRACCRAAASLAPAGSP